jgi:hypothetical protein
MEQVEDVKRYRKVVDTVRIKHVRGRLEDGSFELKSTAKSYFADKVEEWNGLGESGDTQAFVKAFDNWYDVDGTTLLGWVATVCEFELVERQPKAVKVKVVREVKSLRELDKNGRRIVYTNGKRVVKRRGMASATVVKKTTTTPITAEELQARRERLRGGHFVGATYLGK